MNGCCICFILFISASLHFAITLPFLFYYPCFRTVRIILSFRYSPSVRVPLILSRKSLSTVDSALVFRFNWITCHPFPTLLFLFHNILCHLNYPSCHIVQPISSHFQCFTSSVLLTPLFSVSLIFYLLYKVHSLNPSKHKPLKYSKNWIFFVWNIFEAFVYLIILRFIYGEMLDESIVNIIRENQNSLEMILGVFLSSTTWS